MAAGWQDAAARQAELVASRLRELLSSGVGLLRTELGVDVGVRPELLPTWLLLSAALLGLLVLLVLWAAACGGIRGASKRPVRPVEEEEEEEVKVTANRVEKAEDVKRKSKKKATEKKPQPNGRPVAELQNEVKLPLEVVKPIVEVKPEKVKKNKKKPKAEVKEVKAVSSSDGKEPDEGAWETKISNREKRQQRRKDKAASDDSGSPGGVELQTSVPVDLPKNPAPVTGTKGKNKGEPARNKSGKEVIQSQVSASWAEPAAVNGRGWSDLSPKLSPVIANMDGENWSSLAKGGPCRNQDSPAWGMEISGSWCGVDGRMKKKDLTGVSVSTRPMAPPAESQPVPNMKWESHLVVDEEWSGFNGMPDDPSSDWNAPTEAWGNYVEPQPEPKAAPEEPPLVPVKVSDDDKDKEDSGATGSQKAKKKKKRKKKQGEDAGTAGQEVQELQNNTPAATGTKNRPVQETEKPVTAVASEVRVERPAAFTEISQKPTAPQKSGAAQKPNAAALQRPAEPEPASKRGSPPSQQPPLQKKSEENSESLKQVKKKKARRET